MSRLLLLLLALTVFIGEALAWPGLLRTPARRAIAGVTTIATALTGAHVANVQLQRHRNHQPWYDEDDFWLSVLQLPQSAPQPPIPLPDSYFMDIDIDYVHVWNANSPLSTIVAPDSDLHLHLQDAVYLSNSKAEYVLFKTNFHDTDSDNTLGSSQYNLLDEPFPIDFSFDQQPPSHPIMNFNLDWLAVGLLSIVAAVMVIYIAIKRSRQLLQAAYDNTGAAISELNRAIADQSGINQQLNGILREMTEVFESVIATQQVVCNDLNAAYDTSSARIAGLEAALERQVESAKATHAAQVSAEDELRTSNVTNKSLAAELKSAKEDLASRENQFADLQERWNNTSMSKRLARRQAQRDDSAAASSTEAQEGPVVNLPPPPPQTADYPQAESSTSTATPSPAPAPASAPAAPSPADYPSVQQSSPKDSGSKAGLGPPVDAPQNTSVDPPKEPLADAPKGPKIDPNTLTHSNKTVYFNAAAKKRDRTNAPLAEPSSSSSSSSGRPFSVPKLTRAEEKQQIKESSERAKRRAEAAKQEAEQEKK